MHPSTGMHPDPAAANFGRDSRERFTLRQRINCELIGDESQYTERRTHHDRVENRI